MYNARRYNVNRMEHIVILDQLGNAGCPQTFQLSSLCSLDYREEGSYHR